MYFIEKIIKLFTKKKKYKTEYLQNDVDTCQHLFLPIDSSGEYLACTKCGKLIKNNNKNLL